MRPLRRGFAGLVGALALAHAGGAAAQAAPMKAVAPENLLVIDTGKGRILIEMRPDLAPGHVARVRELAREGYYDGALFYRVLDGYMAQGGDRSVTGSFTSDKPNLKGEFTVAGAPAAVEWLGASPLRRTSDGTTFARFCAGTASFAHYDDPDTANSQFFLMRGANDWLERKFTVWGRVVVGLDVVRALNVGEPPANPDLMTRVRVAADLPEAERPTVEIADTASTGFAREVEKARKAREKAGQPFSLCDVEVAARVR